LRRRVAAKIREGLRDASVTTKDKGSGSVQYSRVGVVESKGTDLVGEGLFEENTEFFSSHFREFCFAHRSTHTHSGSRARRISTSRER